MKRGGSSESGRQAGVNCRVNIKLLRMLSLYLDINMYMNKTLKYRKTRIYVHIYIYFSFIHFPWICI